MILTPNSRMNKFKEGDLVLFQFNKDCKEQYGPHQLGVFEGYQSDSIDGYDCIIKMLYPIINHIVYTHWEKGQRGQFISNQLIKVDSKLAKLVSICF